MSRQITFSFIAYDAHGELLGYMQKKQSGSGLCTVHHPSGKIMFVSSSQIGRYETYSLQALMRQKDNEQKEYDVKHK